MPDPQPIDVVKPSDVVQGFSLGALKIVRVNTPHPSVIVSSNVSVFQLLYAVFILSLQQRLLSQNQGASMTDPKTTLTAFFTGLFAILAYFGIIIPDWAFEPIIAVGIVILGWFSADKKKTTP